MAVDVKPMSINRDRRCPNGGEQESKKLRILFTCFFLIDKRDALELSLEDESGVKEFGAEAD